MFSTLVSDFAYRTLRRTTRAGVALLYLVSVACSLESSSATAPEAASFVLEGAPHVAPTPKMSVSPPGPRARSSDLLALPFFVRAESGRPVDSDTPPATPLYEAILGNPVLAPSGEHVSWVQWNEARGRIQVRCTRQGTHTVLHLDGLIPLGVYTIWNVVFQEPGFTGEFVVPGSIPAHAIGFGPAGPPSGEQSRVRASPSGRADISIMTPGGELGSAGKIGHCALTDEFEWHVVGLYHIDGVVYGPVRGPDGTRAEHFAFVFRSDVTDATSLGEENDR